VEVKVKFVNRTKRKVQVVWIDHKKKWEKKKVLKPGKCYTTKSYEGNCWVAHDEKDEDEGLFLNYGYFYSPWKTRRAIERVIITEGMYSLMYCGQRAEYIYIYLLYIYRESEVSFESKTFASNNNKQFSLIERQLTALKISGTTLP
jgi:hypothetical protein